MHLEAGLFKAWPPTTSRRLPRSPLAYCDRPATSPTRWQRGIAGFADHGIRIERVRTDNGPSYRSALWLQVCRRHGITPKRPRAYRPQTNGKVQRFHRTVLVEWA